MKGDTIRAIRICNGMTQAEFALALGVSRSIIAMVETGYQNVSKRLMVKICQRFEIDGEVLATLERLKALEKLA